MGGKLTTFRLMAQQAVDLAGRKLQVERACRSHQEPISPEGKRYHTLGQRLEQLESAPEPESVICECDTTSGRLPFGFWSLEFVVRDRPW
ncbi:MAG: hypothetical protein HY784_11065 [Chloroflexi bacterium]|nr:hypothetical protein [Chloroflexota bacterium]